jgi:hypothetical protein
MVATESSHKTAKLSMIYFTLTMFGFYGLHCLLHCKTLAHVLAEELEYY